MNGYRELIIQATGCPESDANEVEELMRLETGGTLDHLRRAEFKALARVAYNARQILKGDELEES